MDAVELGVLTGIFAAKLAVGFVSAWLIQLCAGKMSEWKFVIIHGFVFLCICIASVVAFQVIDDPEVMILESMMTAATQGTLLAIDLFVFSRRTRKVAGTADSGLPPKDSGRHDVVQAPAITPAAAELVSGDNPAVAPAQAIPLVGGDSNASDAMKIRALQWEAGAPMTILQILFSFEGRLTRAPFLAIYIPVVVAAVFLKIFADALNDPMVLRSEASGLWWVGCIIAILLVVWINFAIIVKRCHDLNKSGSWALLSCIPLVGFLWAIIELGCFPGTRGPNRYGPDPRGTSLQALPSQASSSQVEPVPEPMFRDSKPPSTLTPPQQALARETPHEQATEPLEVRRPGFINTISTTAPSQLDPALQPYSREHKERLKLEGEFAAFGERVLAALRDQLGRGSSLADALHTTKADLRHRYRLDTDEAFERARRALIALQATNQSAHQEIIDAYTALGPDFDWDAALERLKIHHKSDLDPATITDLAWLFDPTRERELALRKTDGLNAVAPVTPDICNHDFQPPYPREISRCTKCGVLKKKSHAGITTLVVFILIAGLAAYFIINSESSESLDTTGLTPAEGSEVVAYREKVAALMETIASGSIKPTKVSGITAATQDELDKKGELLPDNEVGELEVMQTWWMEGELANNAHIRIVLDNVIARQVKGIEFELSDARCDQKGASVQGWIIDLAQPIQADAKTYVDISLPVSYDSDLRRNKRVCGIIRQAW